MNRIILILIAISIFLCPVAQAKDFKFMPSVDGGFVWFSYYDSSAKKVDVDPAPAYGGTLIQLFDFEWAKNMALELTYFHSVNRAEWTPLDEDESKFLFDMTCDYSSLGVGYFFSGRRIHPYIAAGFGAAFIKYVQDDNFKIWETDGTFNTGAGLDYTVYEPPGGAGLNQLNLGARVRYIYIFPNEIVDSGIIGINIMARLQLRF